MRNYFIPTVFSVATLASTILVTAAFAGDKPVAYVNDAPITTSDIEEQMKSLPPMLASGREDEVRQAIIERLIQKRLIVEEAKKTDIEHDPAFLAQLETLRENLLFNFVISKKLNDELTQSKLKKYYDENASKYSFPSVKASHILVKEEKEAKRLIKRLSKGEEFKKLAIEFSTGPSASNGGSLGWLAPNTMVEPFEDAVFSMDAGTFSKEPVKTQFGYHVIKVFEKNDNYVPPFDELESSLQEELGQIIVENYIKELQEKAKIRYEAN